VGTPVGSFDPNADRVEGDVCYPDLKSIPGGVDAVVIDTRPQTAVQTRSFGSGSVSDEATAPACLTSPIATGTGRVVTKVPAGCGGWP
jgi:uncharacterized protein